MLPEEVEKLREQFSDQYVVVDAQQPELARFEGTVGQVKTVNMNGRALVEFDSAGNRGWYDIAPEYLRVVDKPPPKAVEKKPAAVKAKPAGAPAATTEKSPETGPDKASA